jgi:hypothetical protein
MRNIALLRSQLRKVRRYSFVAGLICGIAYLPFLVLEGFGRGGGMFFFGAVLGLIGALPIPVGDPGSKRYHDLFEVSRTMFVWTALSLLIALVFEVLRAVGVV